MQLILPTEKSKYTGQKYVTVTEMLKMVLPN